MKEFMYSRQTAAQTSVFVNGVLCFALLGYFRAAVSHILCSAVAGSWVIPTVARLGGVLIGCLYCIQLFLGRKILLLQPWRYPIPNAGDDGTRNEDDQSDTQTGPSSYGARRRRGSWLSPSPVDGKVSPIEERESLLRGTRPPPTNITATSDGLRAAERLIRACAERPAIEDAPFMRILATCFSDDDFAEPYGLQINLKALSKKSPEGDFFAAIVTIHLKE